MTDGPDFSLADVRREGLITPSGAEPATHDGTAAGGSSRCTPPRHDGFTL